MGVNVLLTIERNGKALTLGRVKDQLTVLQVARRCIREKQIEADLVSRVDAELGVVARGELRQVEQTLASLLPRLGRP
jgi:hypothetical protein